MRYRPPLPADHLTRTKGNKDYNNSQLKIYYKSIKRLEPIPIETIIRTAIDYLDGYFLAEDLQILTSLAEDLRPRFPALSEILIPQAVAAPAPEIFTGLVQKVQTFVSGMPRHDATHQATMGYLLPWGTFKKYGPALAALHNLRSELRFAVIAEGTPEEAAVQMGIVRDVNRALDPGVPQILIYETPIDAALSFPRKVSTLSGIGLDPLTAALIVRYVPTFQNKDEGELSHFISRHPSLQALLDQFSSEVQRALETAA